MEYLHIWLVKLNPWSMVTTIDHKTTSELAIAELKFAPSAMWMHTTTSVQDARISTRRLAVIILCEFTSSSSFSTLVHLCDSRCYCRAESCYAYGNTWKTCSCPQWDETQLIERATVHEESERMQREFWGILENFFDFTNQSHLRRGAGDGKYLAQREPGRDAVPALQQQRMAEIEESLRTGHECRHDCWKTIRGRHSCEECSHTLPYYINQCRQCHMRACNRHRQSRLWYVEFV